MRAVLRLGGVVALVSVAACGGACPDGPLNAVVLENCLHAGTSERYWDVNGAGDPDIQGFSDKFSYSPSETVVLRVLTLSDKYRVDVYRLGYYGGAGARLVGSVRPSAELPQGQPECLRDPATHLVDCGNWEPSASFTLAANATSGVYIARLTREDSIGPSVEGAAWRSDYSQMRKDVKFARPGADEAPDGREDESGGGLQRRRVKMRNELHEPRASHVYFVVKGGARREGGAGEVSDVLFQTSDATYQAYNRYGGRCTYGSYVPGQPLPRSYVASYNRPFENRDYRAINLFLGAEYPAIRFLERNGFDVSYASGQDVARISGALLRQRHKVFLSVGHDEYWSKQQRSNVEAARDLGLHMQFWSGNQVFWKVRWEHSHFAEPNAAQDVEMRTMVCYKETQEKVKIDPRADMWTGTFRDGRPINPDGPNPENSLSGLMFAANAWRNDPLVVPRRFSLLPLWRATAVEQLFFQRPFLRNVVYPGNQAVLDGGLVEPWVVLKQGVLGHEWDEDVDNGHRPPGMVRMSETRVDNICYIQDAGSIYDTGSGTHRLVMYKHAAASTAATDGDQCSSSATADAAAIVFGTGTVQWSWGLDDHHDNEAGLISQTQNGYSTRVGIDLRGPDRNVQQATVNVFGMMGVQPETLEPGLVRGQLLAPRDQQRAASTCEVAFHSADGLLEAVSARVLAPPDVVIAAVEIRLQHRWHPAEPDMLAYVEHPDKDPSYGRLWRIDLDQQHRYDADLPLHAFCRFTTDDLVLSRPSGPFPLTRD